MEPRILTLDLIKEWADGNETARDLLMAAVMTHDPDIINPIMSTVDSIPTLRGEKIEHLIKDISNDDANIFLAICVMVQDEKIAELIDASEERVAEILKETGITEAITAWKEEQ